MKAPFIILSLLMLLILVKCKTTPNEEASIYTTSWELEFIAGQEVTFDELYPNKKPAITFNEETHKADGTNSCNGYSASFTVDKNGNIITFGEPGPTTKMFCGNGEGQFLQAMEQINSYSIDEAGKLYLSQGDEILLRFKPIAKN